MFKKRLSQVLWAIKKWFVVDTMEWWFPIKQDMWAPLALWAANVLALTSLTTEAQTITTGITNPDVLRCVSIVWDDASIVGNVTINWTDWADRVILDVIALSWTSTVKGNKAFKTITSIELPVLTTAWDKVSVWLTDKLGLYRDIEDSTDVVSVYTDTTRETTTAAVKTLTASADFVATDVITVDIDWVTITQEFDTDNDTTIAALATQIAAEDWIATAVVTDSGTSDHEIVITAAVAGVDFTITNATEDTSGTTTFSTAVTTANVSLPAVDVLNSTVETVTATDGSKIVTINYLTKCF